MGMRKEIEIDFFISKDIIKPSSPTPPHLKLYQISLLDQFVPAMLNAPLLLFYANGPTSALHNNKDKRNSIISQSLKKSLSDILTRFYPLAGRIRDHFPLVECNDEGVYYLEARVNCSLSDILDELKIEETDRFIPRCAEFGTKYGPLLIVQATYFECGGIALGLSVSHKVGDAVAVHTFTKSWADAVIECSDVVALDNSGTYIFPPRHPLPVDMFPDEKFTKSFVSRRFVFNPSKIAALKAEASTPMVQPPSRVLAISALLWKCSMNASRLRSRSPRPSTLTWAVNIRSKLVPPLSQTCFGNLCLPLSVQANGREPNLSNIASCLRYQFVEFNDRYVKNLHDNESGSLVLDIFSRLGTLQSKSGDIDLYTHSSLCGLPLYEIDFGWGKPMWARLGEVSVPNLVILANTRDGEGIEALVSLVEEDMALFEHDPELLEYASLNPSPLLQRTKRNNLSAL